MSDPHPELPFRQSQELEVSDDGVMEPGYRSKNFWFKDGSIVLLAEKTLFRVHIGVLSVNSPFFRGMFEVPQPENEPLVEGCPVVHVHDAANDWNFLLMSIYHSASVAQFKKPLPLVFLASLMRLGKKYQCDAIRDNAVNRLKRNTPKHNFKSTMACMEKTSRRMIAEILNLALELSIQSVLPICYYICATHCTTVEIMSGVPDDRNGDITHLAPETQRLLLFGRDKLDAGIKDHCMTWLLHPSFAVANGELPECLDHMKCSLARGNCMQKYSTLVGAERYRWIESASDNFSTLCANCATAAGYQSEQSNAAFWNALPSFFDLPDWENLRDFE